MKETPTDADTMALVLAGGLGTRLRPLTDRIPKCLVEIGGFPLLEGWHAALADAGLERAIVNAHAHAAQVEAWAEAATSRGPVEWSVFREPELLGSAGTLRAVLPELERGSDFLVIYGDNLSEVDLGAFLAFHRESHHEFTIALHEVPDPESKGVVELDGAGRVVSFEEKPERPRSNLVNAGLYAISRGVLDSIDWADAFDLGHDVLPLLLDRMAGYRLRGYHRDIGTPDSLESAERDLREGSVHWPRGERTRSDGGKS